MSDDLADTPTPLPSYCASCFPDLDTRGYIQTPCCEHQPEIPTGLDDDRMGPSGYLAGSAECGDGNAAWCRLFHEQQRGPA